MGGGRECKERASVVVQEAESHHHYPSVGMHFLRFSRNHAIFGRFLEDFHCHFWEDFIAIFGRISRDFHCHFWADFT